MVHRASRNQVVDRVPYLVALCEGRRVLHLGFVDTGLAPGKRAAHTWLHEALAPAARELVGIDLDNAGVAQARAEGFEAYGADCQSVESLRAVPAAAGELVLAGELLEHLERPGDFLEAAHAVVGPGGTLVLTTPNAFSVLNFAAALFRREIVNPDHVSWYSATTVRTLLSRHGWKVNRLSYYLLPRLVPRPGLSAVERTKLVAFNAFSLATLPLVRAVPLLGHGLIVEATSVW
jgi:2-polyprenyl-3-methyl-5-hydroxy-6-metoxy-1,4-benzoquinol methylase